MRQIQRTITLTFLIILTLGTISFGINNIVTKNIGDPLSISSIFFALFYIGLTIAYWRGWDYARYIVVLSVTLGIWAIGEPYLTQQFASGIFVIPVVALMLSGPWSVLASAVGAIFLLALKAGFQGANVDPANLIIYGLVVGGIIMARLVSDRAQKLAEANARRAEEALEKSEGQARELLESNEVAHQQLEEQRRLLDLVATLETPAMQLADGVLFAPLVGHLDSRRTQGFTSRLLQAAHEQRARHIVIDIAGVAMVDTAVARALIGTIQSLRLLGCEVTISGISANVAITLTQLGVDLSGVTTVRNPQEALARVMNNVKSPTAAPERQAVGEQKLNGAGRHN
jgi:rsbT co-antagonist protein RsbR